MITDQELQRVYATVAASLPDDARLYTSSSNPTTFDTATNLKQSTFKARIAHTGIARELIQTSGIFAVVELWTATVLKYVNASRPTTANNYSSADRFLALGKRFRVESVEDSRTYQFSKIIHLRWSPSDTTVYGTYTFTGVTPYDVILTQSNEELLTESGLTILY